MADYRKMAYDNYPHKCDECGWDMIPQLLEAHHVSFCHTDDFIDNLRLLCPTCHRVEHWVNKMENGGDAIEDWES